MSDTDHLPPPAARTRGQIWTVLMVVGLSTPLALVAETGLRSLLFPPEFEEVRVFLRPVLNTPMWLMVACAALLTPLGIRFQRRRVVKVMAKRPQTEQTAYYRNKANFDAMMLSTSLPQIPGIIATFGYMLGADILPVGVAISTATLGVFAIGAAVLRAAEPPVA